MFTANPEDYTARGKIITPLKDRIGAEVMTHYPQDLEHGVAITEQEAWTERGERTVQIPRVIKEIVERVAFEAREDQRVDRRSGVSQRLPIAVLESVVSNAERRAIANGAEVVVPWVADIYSALPAITGKLELEYEGELEGGVKIALDLISQAAGATFDEYFIEEDAIPIVEYFDNGGALQVAELSSPEACLKGFSTVPGLVELARTAAPSGAGVSETANLVVASELVLEGLVAKSRIARSGSGSYRRRKERPRRSPGHGLGGSTWPNES